MAVAICEAETCERERDVTALEGGEDKVFLMTQG